MVSHNVLTQKVNMLSPNAHTHTNTLEQIQPKLYDKIENEQKVFFVLYKTQNNKTKIMIKHILISIYSIQMWRKTVHKYEHNKKIHSMENII